MSMNFKVGQRVLVHKGKFVYMSNIEKITPSGLIKVDGKLYYPDGRERTADCWNYSTITLATDYDIVQLKKSRFIQRVYDKMKTMNNKLTYEQAIEINRILQLEVPYENI